MNIRDVVYNRKPYPLRLVREVRPVLTCLFEVSGVFDFDVGSAPLSAVETVSFTG